MPRMPKYLKREWAFFLDERGRKKYNELCRKCERSCKQSFRATVIYTAHTIYRKGEQDNDRLSEQHSRKAGNHQGKRHYYQLYTGAFELE